MKMEINTLSCIWISLHKLIRKQIKSDASLDTLDLT